MNLEFNGRGVYGRLSRCNAAYSVGFTCSFQALENTRNRMSVQDLRARVAFELRGLALDVFINE